MTEAWWLSGLGWGCQSIMLSNPQGCGFKSEHFHLYYQSINWLFILFILAVVFVLELVHAQSVEFVSTTHVR